MSKIILYLLSLILISPILNEEQKLSSSDLIVLGSKQGYDLSNQNDKFFSDICQIFTSENGKDVSIEYRRKYYFVRSENTSSTNDEEINKEAIVFPPPYRISILDCLLNYSTIFKNYLFYILVIIFTIQFYLTNSYIMMKYKRLKCLSSYFLIQKNVNTKKNYLSYFIIKNEDTNESIDGPGKNTLKENIKNLVQRSYSSLVEETVNNNTNNDRNNDVNSNYYNTELKTLSTPKNCDFVDNNNSGAYLKKLCFQNNFNSNRIQSATFQEVDLRNDENLSKEYSGSKNKNIDDFIENKIHNRIKSKK